MPREATIVRGDEAIERFSRALRLAIYDRDIEEKTPIHFCYDADVVMRMVLGFEQFREARPIENQRHMLVRALLSSGYLGTMSLLRPHALELHQALGRKASYRSSHSRESYRKRLRAFLSAWKVEELFKELTETIGKGTEAEKASRFLERLQELAPRSFIAVELANGSWQQRLTRFAKVGILNLSESSVSLRDVVGDPVVWCIKDIIESGIERLDESLSISRLRDATALTILYKMIRRFEAGEQIPQVRFFTESEFLSRAWQNEDLIHLLSYSSVAPSLPGGAVDETFVIRDTDYFVLRASFEALRFPPIEILSEVPLVSLEVLREVSDELQQLLGRTEEEIERFVGSRLLGDRKLADYLADFRSLAFLNSIWFRYKPPDLLQEFVRGLAEVWEFTKRDITGEALRNRIRHEATEIQETLRAGVEEVDEWFRIFDAVSIRSENIIRRSKQRIPMPHAERDLGIARWGLELSEGGVRRFQNLARPLLSSDHEEWLQGCADFAAAVLDVGDDPEECAVVCAILWWLNGFRTLVKTIEGLEMEMPSLPAGLHIMRAAAKLQNAVLDSAGKATLIGEEEALIKCLPESVATRYLVGLSYLYYRAWASEAGERAKNGSDPAEVKLHSFWARESFRLADEAAGLLLKGSLKWAFAVNTCAYVGVAAAIEPERTSKWIEILSGLAAEQDLWHYRFADTISYHYFNVAKKKHERGEGNSAVCALLSDSAAFLRGAEMCYGDRAIAAHRNELKNFIRIVGCEGIDLPE